MGKWSHHILAGSAIIMMMILVACGSQPIAQEAPTPTLTVTPTLEPQIAVFNGAPEQITAIPTITLTPTVTPFAGVIPTLSSESPTPTATITTTPTDAALAIYLTENAVQHTVAPGETITLIANQYNVTVDDLLAANNMYRDQTLFVGRVLMIPVPIPTMTPSPTIDPDDSVALFVNAIRQAPPESRPVTVNELSFDEFFVMDEDTIANVQAIYAEGQRLGRNANAFTRIGDSTIEAPHFLYRFDGGDYNLGEYRYLQRTIDYYSGSFNHDSVAVIRGLHTWSVFDPMWSPAECDPGENMLACEFRLHNPSVIFIRIGTNNRGSAETTRENFEEIVTFCIDNGVIPIMGTKADRFDGQSDSVNTIIRDIAEDYDLPLWDFDLVASTIPGHGLTGDNVHLSVFYAHDWRLQGGFTTGHGLHNLTALIVLDELRGVLDDE